MEEELETIGGGQGRGILSLSNKIKVKEDEVQEGLLILGCIWKMGDMS